MLMKGIDIEALFATISVSRTLNFIEAMILDNEIRSSSSDQQPQLRELLMKQFRKSGKVTKKDEMKLYEDGEEKPILNNIQTLDPNRGFKDLKPLN
jgi:hypothetical protein